MNENASFSLNLTSRANPAPAYKCVSSNVKNLNFIFFDIYLILIKLTFLIPEKNLHSCKLYPQFYYKSNR